MNGWYMVYLIAIVLNAILCSFTGYDIFDRQYWAHTMLIILAYVAGKNNK